MLRRFVIACTALVMIFVGACSDRGDSAGQEKTTTALTATDKGISPTEIRIAIVADVDTPIVPGLFQESVDGIKAWAAYQNRKGGLAGRHVVVDFYDSKVNGDEWRNAVIKACASDFAMVGTTSVVDASVTEMVDCAIPEIPQLTVSAAHRTAPNSFATFNGPPNQVLIGPQQWFLEKYGAQGCCKGVWLYPSEVPETLALAKRAKQAALDNGYTFLREFPLNARDPNYVPYAQAIKRTGATYVASLTDFNQWALLRREAKVQGVDKVLAWDCSLTCYDPAFLKVGGADVEGQYTTINFLPFEEADQYPAVQSYLTELKRINPNAQINGLSVGTWIGGLLFGEAVQKVVKDKGVNALTRANLLSALHGIHDFDADGLTGPTDVGNKAGTRCFVLMQVQGGKFVRAYPSKGIDCNADNAVISTS